MAIFVAPATTKSPRAPKRTRILILTFTNHVPILLRHLILKARGGRLIGRLTQGRANRSFSNSSLSGRLRQPARIVVDTPKVPNSQMITLQNNVSQVARVVGLGGPELTGCLASRIL